MILDTLLQLYTQDLHKLKSEIEQYQSESNIWEVRDGIANSAGNLCLHLTGNLNAFLGVGLADSGYVRDREREFAAKNVGRDELLSDIEGTIDMVHTALTSITEENLSDLFPIQIWSEPKTIYFALTRLLSHFSYHLGQINYHRRMIDQGHELS